MFPSMDPRQSRPVQSRPHLVLKLRPGWRFDEESRQFTSASEDEPPISMQKVVPQAKEVLPRVPTASSTAASEAERDLACYWNLMLPNCEDVADAAVELRKLDCVEQVDLPPQPELPCDTTPGES